MILPYGNGFGFPINGGRGRENDFLYLKCLHHFNQFQTISHVIVEIFYRVLNGFSYQAIGCKMHYGINWVGLKSLFQLLLIRQVPLYEEGIHWGISMTGLKIVEDNGCIVLVEKIINHMTSDISHSTRYKNCWHLSFL